EDLHVMLLPLPRLVLRGGNETGSQGVEPVMRFLQLLVHEADAGNEGGDMRARSLGRTSSDLHWRLAQNPENMGGIEASNAIALENFSDRRLSGARGLVWRRHGFPQIEYQLCSEIALEFEHGGKIAPELLAHTVGQPDALGTEVLSDPRPFAQLYDHRIGDSKQPKA